jgi:hypothetical protein
MSEPNKQQEAEAPLVEKEEVVKQAGPPTQVFELPSRGYLYEGRLPEGKVELSPMTIQEEKLLLSMQADKLDAFNRLIERCLKTKTIPLDEYTIGDKFFMLLMIRVISYPRSVEYNFECSCPSCRAVFQHTVNLRDGLKIKALTSEDKEPFDVLLPVSQKTVGLRHLCGKDEVAIEKFTRRALRNGKANKDGDPAYIFRLSRRIVTIDGVEVDAAAALAFCNKLYSEDSLTISEVVEENDCGVELLLDLVCAKCFSEFSQMLPFTLEFFRPRVSRNSRNSG